MGFGRTTRARLRRGQIAFFWLMSVASHFAVFLLVQELDVRGCGSSMRASDVFARQARRAAAANRPVEVTLLEPRPLVPGARSIEEELEKEREKKIEEAKKPEEEDPNGQIVELPKPNVEIRPESARVLSEYDTKVEKETKAHGNPGVRTPGGAPPSEPAEADPRRPGAPGAPGAASAAPSAAPGTLALRPKLGVSDPKQPAGNPEGQARPEAPGGETPREGTNQQASARPSKEAPSGEGGEGGEGGTGAQPVKPSDLALDKETYSKTLGAGSIDHLKDIDEGTETLLNSRRNYAAGFFNRMKRSVAAEWHPERTYAMRDPSGQIYGVKNRYTVLKVSLKPDGSVHGMLVEKASGVDFLDEEALSAFEAAQPFPNPPARLVDPDSKLITFRFGFYFEIDRSPGIRVIWQ
jgi:TonB family protein